MTEPSSFLARSRPALWRLGLFAGIALLLASGMPAGLVMASFGALLKTGAFVALAMAAFARDDAWQPKLTRWDEAALLFLAGTLVVLTTDAEQVQSLLQQHGFGGSGPEGTGAGSEGQR